MLDGLHGLSALQNFDSKSHYLKTFVACSIGRYAKKSASGSSSAPNSNHDDAGGREYEAEDILFLKRQKGYDRARLNTCTQAGTQDRIR